MSYSKVNGHENSLSEQKENIIAMANILYQLGLIFKLNLKEELKR